jgi:hypothetical protein
MYFSRLLKISRKRKFKKKLFLQKHVFHHKLEEELNQLSALKILLLDLIDDF